MTIYRLVLAASLLAAPFSTFASAQLKCHEAFQVGNKSYKDYLRPVPEDDFVVYMRSNPAGSLAWFNEKIMPNLASAELNSIAKKQGYIGGDVKPDNVDMVSTKGKKFIAVIDLDDGGVGPFVADFFHSLVYNRVWPVSIKFKDAVDAYQDGLKGKKLRDIVDLNDIWKERSDEKINHEKMEKSEKNFLEMLKLTSVKEAEPNVRALFERNEKLILKKAESFGDIVHFGVRVKTSGGSMGAPRFSFLVKDSNKELKIIEFKFQPSPAVAALGTAQPPHTERIKNLIRHYKPQHETGNILGVLDTKQDGTFLIRVRVPSNFDAASIPKSQKDTEAYDSYIRHMFHMMGNAHARQSPEYVREFNDNLHKIEGELEALVEEQVNLFRSEFEASKAKALVGPAR